MKIEKNSQESNIGKPPGTLIYTCDKTDKEVIIDLFK
jgi:hypothetical protein